MGCRIKLSWHCLFGNQRKEAKQKGQNFQIEVMYERIRHFKKTFFCSKRSCYMYQTNQTQKKLICSSFYLIKARWVAGSVHLFFFFRNLCALQHLLTFWDQGIFFFLWFEFLQKQFRSFCSLCVRRCPSQRVTKTKRTPNLKYSFKQKMKQKRESRLQPKLQNAKMNFKNELSEKSFTSSGKITLFAKDKLSGNS